MRVRDGQTGARGEGDIGFAALRGGTVVGDHSVIFAGAGERHELAIVPRIAACSPAAPSGGAVGLERKPGYYSMADVLGLGPA